jgi:uncharacterized protein (TIGR02646 family)
MIRILKPAAPPEVLEGKGKTATDGNCDSYTADQTAYDDGTRTFSFDSAIYGHSSVKDMLIEAQHGKCCFCEAKITHISYGDVEHFRPKAGYRQDPDGDLARPGYYWLAYDWSNLYLSCQLCNQRYKKNSFPLQNPKLRCRDHLGNLTLEEPLFIDPGAANPEDHIEFSAEQPIARNGSLHGLETIKALGLLREPLRERRHDKYVMLSTLRDVALLNANQPLGQRARDLLDKAVADDAEYASMARCLMSKP